MKKIALVLNSPSLNRLPKDADIVICADGGARYYNAPDILLGDMDSLNTENNAKKTIVLPVHKDYTDGEFAIKYIYENLMPACVDIYGMTGGRLDQVLGNLTLLYMAKNYGIQATGHSDTEDIYFVTDASLSIEAKENDTISIVPFKTDVYVDGTNLEYPLDNLRIPMDSTLGISNKVVEDGLVQLFFRGSAFVIHCIKSLFNN